MIPGNANPLLLATAAAGAAAIATKSLRFNSGDSAYLNKTLSSGNRKKWTYSAWVKRTQFNQHASILTVNGSEPRNYIRFTNDYLYVGGADGDATGSYFGVRTPGKFRDPAAWYHIVVVMDSDQAVDVDRTKIYVNGVLSVEGTSDGYLSQGQQTQFNSADPHYIGWMGSGSNYFNGYLADVYFIDGSALDPTSFGAYDDNGVWQAIGYSGTYGTNGFHLLDFENESTVGHDSSGNENDWTANNFSTTAGAGNDVLFDVPTNGTQSDTGAGGEVSGNYCTINPLSIPSQSVTVSNGNLDHTGAGTNVARVGTIAIPSSGKWYWEITCNSGGSGAWLLGINGDTNSQALRLAYVSDARKYTDAGGGFSSYGASFGVGDVIGVAVDMDADTLTFYKNGSSQGTAFTSISSGYTNIFPYFQTEQSGRGLSVNFGQRAWAYSAPSNHKALCTTNLPTPTIADGSDYFDTLLWTGDNAVNRTLTGLEFSPDLVWHQARSIAWGSGIVDAVRGVGSGGPTLRTFNNSAEETVNNFGAVTALTSDGFTVSKGGFSSNQWAYVNQSGATYCAWCWDAGSSTASNTDGSITSSVRANQTAGFSVVSWDYDGTTGQYTVGHGLNTAPSMIIVRPREITSNWGVYHSALGNTKGANLNQTSASSTSTGWWNNTSPTSSVFTLSTFFDDDSTYIAYCFAPVAGYSAFGEFTSNNSTDNVFIHTGFAPRWLIWKNTVLGGWFIYDAARNTYNPRNSYLAANVSDAEADATPGVLDFLSNGFKVRNTLGGASPFIWAAFASNPFQANGGLAR